MVVGPQETETKDRIAQGLIYLGRMLRKSLSVPLEDDSPGEGRHVAVDLAVEKVAKAYQGSGEADRDDKPVHYPQEIETVFPAVMGRVPPHREKQGDGAAVARQAALPGHEYLQEAFPAAEIVVGLVEDAVA